MALPAMAGGVASSPQTCSLAPEPGNVPLPEPSPPPVRQTIQHGSGCSRSRSPPITFPRRLVQHGPSTWLNPDVSLIDLGLDEPCEVSQ